MAITQECWEKYWTSPGGNNPQGTNCTATCLLSRKLSKLDEPDTQDTAGEAGTNSSVMYSDGPPHMAKQKQDDQLEHIYTNYVRIRDVALKTCQGRWVIGRSGERGSGISVLAARHDDDNLFKIDNILFKITTLSSLFDDFSIGLAGASKGQDENSERFIELQVWWSTKSSLRKNLTYTWLSHAILVFLS